MCKWNKGGTNTEKKTLEHLKNLNETSRCSAEALECMHLDKKNKIK